MSPEGPDGMLVQWDSGRAAQLVELCAAALPGESLAIDDVEGVCFGAGSDSETGAADLLRVLDVATFATSDGTGAASVSISGIGDHRSAHLQLLVVHPDHRRRGLARTLVAAAEQFAADHDVHELTVGGGAPFYLFTGVDSRWTDALCCLEALGYERSGAELDLVCPTRTSTATPSAEGVVVEHLGSDEQTDELMAMVEAERPLWAGEFRRAAVSGTLVVARDTRSDSVVGAAAHSVGRLGVIGPVLVDPVAHGRGIGSQMMAKVLADLSTAGLSSAEIAWTSTVRFYAESCHATVGRTSLLLRRTWSPPPRAAQPTESPGEVAFGA